MGDNDVTCSSSPLNSIFQSCRASFAMSSDEGGSGRKRSGSRVSRLRTRGRSDSSGPSWPDSDEARGLTSRPIRASRSRPSPSPSPSRFSFSLSSNQATPARSYFQRSFHGSQGNRHTPHFREPVSLIYEQLPQIFRRSLFKASGTTLPSLPHMPYRMPSLPAVSHLPDGLPLLRPTHHN